MRNNRSISTYADLEREEARVKNRLKKRESEIRERLKQLPEEMVKMAVTKTITSIISGSLYQSGKSILRSIFSYFFGKKEEDGTAENGFRGTLSRLIQNFMKKDESKEKE